VSAPLEATARDALARWGWLFWLVGVYDFGLGIAFLLFYEPLFEALDIAKPETGAYVHLAAALIAIQGVGYFLVARRPRRNVDLVLIGVLYKLAYSGLALYYWLIDEAPHEIFLWFGLVDALILTAFVAFLLVARRDEAARGG
jgi:hypothetical protein